jgi:hypothetical protein
LFLAGLVGLLTTGCDTSFDPIKKDHDLAFSMYGTLDLHADTQWVRVMPLSDELIPRNPQASSAEVTIRNLESGEQTTFQDSLLTFPNGAHVWIYWTTQSLEERGTYVVRAESSDGKVSQAEVTIPGRLSMPIVDFDQSEQDGQIYGQTVDPLMVASLHVKYQIASSMGAGPEEDAYISFLYQLGDNRTRDYEFYVDVYGNLSRILELNASTYTQINNKEFTLATGSSDFPTYGHLTKQEMHFPNLTSNVEGGVGYVAGIARRIVPLRSCYDLSGELTPCPAD